MWLELRAFIASEPNMIYHQLRAGVIELGEQYGIDEEMLISRGVLEPRSPGLLHAIGPKSATFVPDPNWTTDRCRAKELRRQGASRNGTFGHDSETPSQNLFRARNLFPRTLNVLRLLHLDQRSRDAEQQRHMRRQQQKRLQAEAIAAAQRLPTPA